MRGPLVYALESSDTAAGVRISESALAPGTPLQERLDRSLLGGVLALQPPRPDSKRVRLSNMRCSVCSNSAIWPGVTPE